MTRRRRTALLLLVLGIAAVATVVTAFVAYDHRDQRTLHEGRATAGTVVRLEKPAWWDVLGSGRIVIRYDLGDRTLESPVWLDNELSDYHLGDPVTVLVRGSHVRTTDESNDPDPVGNALVLLGLVGLSLVVVGGLRLLPPHRHSAAPPGALDRIDLKTFRISPRKAVLDVLPAELSLYLPTYFGSHRVVIPRDGTVVSFLDGPLVDVPDDDVFFKEPPRIAYFPTASVARGPDLVLAFPRPVPVPRLKLVIAMANNVVLPFTRRESRTGVALDAIALRVADLKDARERLRRAGVPEVDDEITWLTTQRALETEPAAIEEARQHDESLVSAGRWGSWLGGIGMALLLLARFTDGLPLFIPGMTLFGLSFLVPWLLVRRARRADRR